MTVSIGDVMRGTAEMVGPRGQTVENVFYFRNDSLFPITDSDAGGDISAFLDGIYGNIAGYMPTDLTFLSIHVHNITQEVSLSDEAWPILTVGVGSGAVLPVGACGLCSFPTGVLRVRGRKYFGPFVEAANDGDIWNAGMLTALAGIATSMLGSWVGADSGGVWLTGIPTLAHGFLSFVEAVISDNPAYQRRRRFGAGS